MPNSVVELLVWMPTMRTKCPIFMPGPLGSPFMVKPSTLMDCCQFLHASLPAGGAGQVAGDIWKTPSARRGSSARVEADGQSRQRAPPPTR